MKIKKVLISIVVTICIELLVINFFNIMEMIDPNIEKNIEFTDQDMQYINWDKVGDKLISQPDPMIIIDKVNTKVKKIEIKSQLEQPIDYILVRYTNEANKEINDNAAVSTQVITGDDTLKIDDYVESVRIDLGNQPGTTLNSIKVIINPAKIKFSLSRVIAMMLIYWSFIALFQLQKTPNYHL